MDGDIKKLLKREIKAHTLAAGVLGESLGDCPVGVCGWKRDGCEDDCGSDGRDGKDNYVRCWREFFIEKAEK